LNGRQRALFVDKLPDAANLAMGGLVFGQFVVTGRFSVGVALLGLVAWAGFMAWATVLAGKDES
jgi:hypothetical protein